MSKVRVVTVAGVSLLIALMGVVGACDGGNGKPAEPSEPVETTNGENTPVVITIGNLTDLTKAPVDAIAKMTLPLEDMARYYSEEHLIEGVEFEVISYDTQYDPARDEGGYETLLEQGADVIFTPSARTGVTLKPRLAADEVVLFTLSPEPEAVEPPGWVFGVGNTCTSQYMYTMLEWISAHDEDFPKDRPARLGGAAWNEAYSESLIKAADAYASAHPDKFEWVGGYLTEFSFDWSKEAKALKDCDYVIPNVAMTTFVKEYRAVGGKGKLIGGGGHLLLLGQIDDAGLWDAVDGMILIRSNLWWNDDGDLVQLARDLLQRYRPSKAEEIMRSGVAYLIVQDLYPMFELIAHTVDTVGPEEFSSRAVYEAANSFSTVADGCGHSFSETKRTSSDALAIYRLDGTRQDIFRIGNEWYPLIAKP